MVKINDADFFVCFCHNADTLKLNKIMMIVWINQTETIHFMFALSLTSTFYTFIHDFLRPLQKATKHMLLFSPALRLENQLHTGFLA